MDTMMMVRHSKFDYKNTKSRSEINFNKKYYKKRILNL